MEFRVEIDKAICQSSGHCVNGEPAAFGFDEDDLGDVRSGAAQLSRERLLTVAANCPAIAIQIFDDRGNAIGSAR
jgi:ferredoxin